MEKELANLKEKEKPTEQSLTHEELESKKIELKIEKNKRKLEDYFHNQASVNMNVQNSKLLMDYIEQLKAELKNLKKQVGSKFDRNYLTKSSLNEVPDLLQNLFKSIKYSNGKAPNDICRSGAQPYKINKNKLLVCLKDLQNQNAYLELELKDIFVLQHESFDGLLFSDSKGNIISAGDNHSSIGFSNMNSVFTQISKENLDIGMFGKFSSKDNNELNKNNNDTPSVSTYTDMSFSGTKYRIFVYPFKIKDELEIGEEKSFYLIGLIKKKKFTSSSQGSNFKKTGFIISFLCVFTFVVALVRLMISEKNIGFGWLFRALCVVSSVSFIVLFNSGLLSFIGYELEKNRKKVEGKRNLSLVQD